MTDAIFYTLQFADGSELVTEFVEHVPYEPSAYHWDEGVIVKDLGSDNLYFISHGTGSVYGGSDEDGDSLTRLIEDARCPLVDEQIKQELAAERRNTPPAWREILPPVYDRDPGDETRVAA